MRLPLFQPGAQYRATRIVKISGVDIYAGEIVPRSEVDDGCMRNLYESRAVDIELQAVADEPMPTVRDGNGAEGEASENPGADPAKQKSKKK